jgi:CheY-like chemotaxis protein
MPTILTVGQDEMLLSTRAAIFRNMQEDVVAANVRDALHILEDNHFDLVVLCHTLSLLEMIQISALAHQRNPGTRVLKVIATPFHTETAADVNADEEAPSDPHILVRRVKELLTH